VLVQTSSTSLFTFDFILGIWIALLLLCGLYLIGVYRLPHDTPEENIGVGRLLFAILFLGLGFYLMPALFKVNSSGETQRPRGTIYAWVDSFLLPEPQHGKETNKTGNLEYAIAQAAEHRQKTGQSQRIFIDFTGELCVICNLNENNVFSKPEFQKLFQNYLVVNLYTDKVPNDYYAPELRAKFGSDVSRQQADAIEANLPFQRKAFNDETLPLYAIVEPQPDGRLLVLGINKKGRIMDEAAFAQFLRDPK
jgi:hypothetical protein